MKRKIRSTLPMLFLMALAGGAYFGWTWLRRETAPMPSGAAQLVRWEKPRSADDVLRELEAKGIVRNAKAFGLMLTLRRLPKTVGAGTYELRPGLTFDEVVASLRKPLRPMVRIPETNWAQRTANLLEQKYRVGSSEEYMKLVRSPGEFKDVVSFPLPADTLEGYLFPDTYELPPLMSSRDVIVRQLRAFDSKVWEGLDRPKNLHQLLIKASLVELEAGSDGERPMIAGVIENRIRTKMRLQIDATILYGMQEWRTLTFADYRNQRNPYNTYLIDGLPPGPICSPSLASIRAAMNPAKHEYFYYLAYGGKTVFAKDYDEHRRNIRLRDRWREARQ
jgi:UPF0755 protein